MTRLTENAWDRLEDDLVLCSRLYPYLVQHATGEAKREWLSRPLNVEKGVIDQTDKQTQCSKQLTNSLDQFIY